MSREPISKGLRFDVLNRDGFRCQYCGADAQTTELHIDHRTPVALGGTNAITNLITACIACNLGKRTKLANLDVDLPSGGVECPFAEGWPNDIEGPVYFYNDTWAITDFGLERLEKFYAIERASLAQRSPADHVPALSLWLEHLSSKIWAVRQIEDSIEALARALRHYRMKPEFDWAASVAFARDRAVGHAAVRNSRRFTVSDRFDGDEDDGEAA